MTANAKEIVQITSAQRDSQSAPENFLRSELSLGAVSSDVET
jgi:hypothetical protein